MQVDKGKLIRNHLFEIMCQNPEIQRSRARGQKLQVDKGKLIRNHIFEIMCQNPEIQRSRASKGTGLRGQRAQVSKGSRLWDLGSGVSCEFSCFSMF